MTLTLTATASTRLTPVSAWPPNTTLSYAATPVVALGTYLVPFADPTFPGTTITRIGNTAGARNTYPRRQCWSYDETMIMLGLSTPGPRMLLRASDYAVLNASVGGDGLWSETENILWRVIGATGAVIRYDPLTNTNLGTVWDLSATYTTTLEPLAQGSLSDDGTYMLLYGITAGQKRVICINLLTGAQTYLNVTVKPHSGSMSHSGTYIHINWDASGAGGSGSEKGVHGYLRDFTWLRQMSTFKVHSDLGVDAFGNEVWVACPNGGAATPMVRLSNGTVTNIWTIQNGFREGHVSCRNSNRPGWAYFSTFEDDTGTDPGTDQNVAVYLDGAATPTVESFGMIHHLVVDDGVSGSFLTPNRNGTKGLFASPWDATDVYAYIAQAT